MQTELPLSRSEEFEELVRSRILNITAVRFLQLMHAAANPSEATPDGCSGVKAGARYILDCQQTRLAELLDCTDRTVRTVVAELEAMNVLRRHRPLIDTPDGTRRALTYVLCLQRLSDLPAVELTEATRQTLADLVDIDPWLQAPSEPEPSEQPVECSRSAPISGPISGPVSGGFSAPISGPVSGGFSGPHDHEGLNELNTQSLMNHEPRPDEHPPDDPPLRFDGIDEEHIRAIGGFMHESGKPYHPLTRLRWFDGYFADAVSAGVARPDERLDLLRVFRMAARAKARDGTAIAHRGAWLRRVWANRVDRKPAVTADDKAVVDRLLSDARQFQETAQ